MRALTAVLVMAVLSGGCASPDRERATNGTRRPELAKRTTSASNTATKKSNVTSKKKAKRSGPERQASPKPPPRPAADPYDPLRLDATYAGLLNDKLHLEGVGFPVTIDKESREKIASLRKGDLVTLLFAPGRVAQVVDFQHASAMPDIEPDMFDGLEKGDRIQLRLSGNAWVTGEVVMLEPRVVIDFSHEASAFVGYCSYDRSAIDELRRMPTLDTSERLHNRLVNSRSHQVAKQNDQRPRSVRGKAVASASSSRPHARVASR